MIEKQQQFKHLLTRIYNDTIVLPFSDCLAVSFGGIRTNPPPPDINPPDKNPPEKTYQYSILINNLAIFAFFTTLLALWNMYDQTTGNLRRFQANVGAYHPNFWKFIAINQSINVVAIKTATDE